MLRRFLLLPLAISLAAACSGGGEATQVQGVSVERSTTTTASTVPSSTSSTSSSTTAAPATTVTTATAPAGPSSTTAPAPTTTTAAPGRPAPTSSPTTAPAPAPTTAPAPAPTTSPPPQSSRQAVTGSYRSPDGTEAIRVDLLDGAGGVLSSHPMGPTGGDFSFVVDPGTYRVQITEAQVVTRTESFTLEAGRSIRFECNARTGCAGVIR